MNIKKFYDSQFKDALSIDAYYGELEENYQSTDASDSKVRLNKIWMNAPPNHGTVQLVLYPSGHDKSYFTHIDEVKQVKFYNKDINEDADVVHRVLPKEYYPDLSQEESTLYDEVNSLFSYVADKELIADYSFKKGYTWTIFFAKLLNAYDLKNGINPDLKAGPSFFVYPGYKVRSNIKDGLDNLTKKGYGPRQNWAGHFFNANETNRSGVISITHSLPNGGGGYSTIFEFIFDNQQSSIPGLPVIKLIPDDFIVSEDDKKLFSNSIIAFLGKMYDYENKRNFNKKVFVAIKNYLSSVITDANAANSTNSNTNPTPENNLPPVNQVPMNGLVDPLANLAIPPLPTLNVPPLPQVNNGIPPIPGT